MDLKKIDPSLDPGVSQAELDAGGISVSMPAEKNVPVKLQAIHTVESADGPETPGQSTYEVPAHDHNGINSPKVKFFDLKKRRETIYVRLDGASPATAANFGPFFIASRPCFVVSVAEVHTTKGTDGGTVSLQIEKLTGTTAPDSGTEMLLAALSLKTNNNTIQYGDFVAARSARTLAKGDRLCLKDSGTLTALAGLLVAVEVEYI